MKECMEHHRLRQAIHSAVLRGELPPDWKLTDDCVQQWLLRYEERVRSRRTLSCLRKLSDVLAKYLRTKDPAVFKSLPEGLRPTLT